MARRRGGANQRLHGDVSTEPRVGGAVHVPHAAPRQEGNDSVRSDQRADSELGLVLRQVAGGEGKGGRLEKPVDCVAGVGEFVSENTQLRVLGREGGSQVRALVGGRRQPRIVPVRQGAPSRGVHGWGQRRPRFVSA